MRKSLSVSRRGETSSSAHSVILTAKLLAMLCYPIVAPAEVTGEASANVQYESNSNIFDLPPHPVQPGLADVRRSDSYISEGAAFKIDDLVARQDFFLSGSVNQFHYDHLTDLDNTGYQVDGGLLWKLTSLLNGKVDVSRTRSMTSFLDTLSTSLSLQTEQRETADFTLRIAPEWRLNGTGYTRTTDQTQSNAPELRLSEQSGVIALNYLGLGNFTSGVAAGYLSGSYSGVPVTLEPTNQQATYQRSTYQQTTFDLLGTYKASGRSTFNGSLGYSNRTSADGLNSTSGLTGNLSFQDQLTPKTAVTLGVARAINSYITTASSEIDTSAQVNASWRATFKLDVELGYTFTYRDFPDQPPIGDPVGTNRVDIQQYATLSLDYQATRWIDIKAFGNVLTRRSNAAEDEFNGTIYGITLVVKTPKPPVRK